MSEKNPKKSAGEQALFPVDELAKRLDKLGRIKYAAARAVYQWDVYAYHNASEFKLSPETFAAALEAAFTYPATDLLDSAKPKG